jgi:hypothetical protein
MLEKESEIPLGCITIRITDLTRPHNNVGDLYDLDGFLEKIGAKIFKYEVVKVIGKKT